jgi:hypothetical protein
MENQKRNNNHLDVDYERELELLPNKKQKLRVLKIWLKFFEVSNPKMVPEIKEKINIVTNQIKEF